MDMSRPTSVFVTSVRRFTAGEDGQDLLEYGLLASLIATFVIGALTMFGGRVNLAWQGIAAANF
jgi:Flp pilus assembly pilin Flp